MFWLQWLSGKQTNCVLQDQIHCHFTTQELRSDVTCHQHLTINDVSKFHQIVFLLAVQLLPTSYPYVHLSKKYFYQQTVKLLKQTVKLLGFRKMCCKCDLAVTCVDQLHDMEQAQVGHHQKDHHQYHHWVE